MKSVVRFRQFLCLLLLGLCLAATGLGSSAASGVSGMPLSRSEALPTGGRLADGSHYDGGKQGSIAYDNSSYAALGYDNELMPFADRRQTASEVDHSLFNGFAEFLATENAGSDTVREAYKALGIETSSTSTAASRVYTVYQQDGSLFKFGVTDANFVRMNHSLELAGLGSHARYTDVMPKHQAHLGEKYLRSLQYSSTGIWPLPGMKVPYPIDFTTKLPVSP
jgi:hypothetical protein